MYKIEKILGYDAQERVDGRYPLRKGCIGNIFHLKAGEVMVFDYIKDNEGNDKTGHMITSLVGDYGEYENGITVYTMNSIYYLKKG